MRTTYFTEMIFLSLLCTATVCLVLLTDWFEHHTVRYDYSDDAPEVAKYIWLFFVSSFSLTLPLYFPLRKHLRNWLAKMFVSTLLVQLFWVLCTFGNWMSLLVVAAHSLGFTEVQFFYAPDVFLMAFLGAGTFFCVVLPFGTRSRFLFMDKILIFFAWLFLACAATELPNALMLPVLVVCHVAFNVLVAWDKLVHFHPQTAHGLNT